MDERRAIIQFGMFGAALLFIKLLLRGDAMAKPPIVSEHSDDTLTKRPTTGRSTGPGFSITWEGSTTPDAASPADVLKAALARMQHLQRTAVGSDRNARALWNVKQAIDVLEGTEVVDGGVDGSGAGFSKKED